MNQPLESVESNCTMGFSHRGGWIGSMEQQLEVFHFEDGKPSFEDFSKANGTIYWYASDFMGMLGYESLSSFKKVINRAISACASLNIPINENFVEEARIIDGETVADFRLTRFACYLVAINGDVKKRNVAAAQAYFITMAETFRQYVQDSANVDRLIIRDELSTHEKTLSAVVFERGITDPKNYAFFQNAGYRGMYNMSLSNLKKRKGVSGARSLLDFMGREELAANLFRITQTEAVIRNKGVSGQNALQNTARSVGVKVRRTVLELSGTPPEDLPISTDIREVRSGLKKTHRGFEKLDKRKKAKLPSN